MGSTINITASKGRTQSRSFNVQDPVVLGAVHRYIDQMIARKSLFQVAAFMRKFG